MRFIFFYLPALLLFSMDQADPARWHSGDISPSTPIPENPSRFLQHERHKKITMLRFCLTKWRGFTAELEEPQE